MTLTTSPAEALPALNATKATTAGSPLSPQTVHLAPEQVNPDLALDASVHGSNPPPETILDLHNEDDHSDNDSGFGVEYPRSTSSSLESSIRQYRLENGRTYHSFREGIYAMPNDEFEQERLDLQNHLFLLSFGGKLYFAPVKDIHSCLDVGTGTGIWAMDFADEHPEAQVIGIDLSPIQPTFVPPNLKFIVDDAEDEWLYNEKFDLIHARMMVGSFLNWPKFMGRAYNQLRPGGYLELQDVNGLASDDDTFTLNPPSGPLAEWWSLVTEAFIKMGRDMTAALQHKENMEKAGFVNVTVIDLKWPINTWPRDKGLKQLGIWSRENTLDALEALAMAPLTRALEWTPEMVQMLLQGARADIKNKGIHAYWNIRVVYGQRPE